MSSVTPTTTPTEAPVNTPINDNTNICSNNNSSDSLILKNLLHEFNLYANQTNEIIRLQNELNKQESELFALQIRFVHK